MLASVSIGAFLYFCTMLTVSNWNIWITSLEALTSADTNHCILFSFGLYSLLSSSIPTYCGGVDATTTRSRSRPRVTGETERDP